MLSRRQIAVLCAVLLAVACQAAVWGWHASLITIIAACEVFYFIFVGFKAILAVASYLPSRSGHGDLPSLDDPDLPTFTVLLPNVKEKAHVLRALLESMAALEYPADKLQIMLLVEHWDKRTLQLFGTEAADSPTSPGSAESEDAERIELAPNVEVVVSIPGAPGTKPAACDFGLYHARGEYTVIFDSEDSPDPRILLKAVRDFRNAPPEVACLQARLLFWNILAGQTRSRRWMAGFVTRMYFVEYVVHFEFVLRGMARIGLVPPLGGHVEHLRDRRAAGDRHPDRRTGRRAASRARSRRRWSAAWDPWCVAEDADIAGWLARSRIPGRDDPGLVDAGGGAAQPGEGRADSGHAGARATRRPGRCSPGIPIRAARQMGAAAAVAYTLMTIGTPLSLMLNPIFWALTLAYLVTRSAFIESLFPGPVFYLGFITAVFGNFMLFYLQVAACLRDREPGLVKYMLALGPWWVFTSYSMWKGVMELFIPSMRFHWHVTEHGIEDPRTARQEIQRRHQLMSARKLEASLWQPRSNN